MVDKMKKRFLKKKLTSISGCFYTNVSLDRRLLKKTNYPKNNTCRPKKLDFITKLLETKLTSTRLTEGGTKSCFLTNDGLGTKVKLSMVIGAL